MAVDLPGNDEQTIYDAAIVGGGAAGLSAALILGRCRRKVIVLDAGVPRNLAAQAIHGFLGHDGIAPLALLEQGRREIARYGVSLVHDVVDKAENLSAAGECPPTRFRVTTKRGHSATCRKLLFATGMRDQLPDVPGIRECYGATVHHCPYCDGYEHRDRRILVLGKQVEQTIGLALAVRGWSSKVTVLADGQRISPADHRRLARNGIAARQETVVRLVHEGNQLRGVELEGNEVLAGEAMFVETVQQSCCELPRLLGVECNERFTGRTSRKQTTNVPGLFLAGDADGNVEFAVVAAAEGATAAVAINRQLQDEDRREP